MRSPRWPSASRTGGCHLLAAPVLCSLRPPSGHRVTSARRAAAVPAPPTLLSPRVIRSPRWPSTSRSGAWHLLAVPGVCSPRPLYRNRVSCARRALARRLCGRRAACLLALAPRAIARRASGVLAMPTLWSPRVIRPPRRRCAHSADFLVAACPAGRLLPAAARLICSQRRWFAPTAKHMVTACHPLAATAVRPPRRVSGRPVSSARLASGVLATPTFRWLRAFRSPRHWCARCTKLLVAACHPLATLGVCYPYQRVPSGRRADGVLAPPTFRSPRAIRWALRRCARAANFPVATCHRRAAPPVC
jgi:hypothetical protein